MEEERTIIVARHGNRQDFVDPAWGRTAALPDDPPLSEDGHVQARELGERLRTEGISHIFASPFLRTVETAHTVAAILDLPLRIESGLSEWLNPEWFPGPPELTPLPEILARFRRIDQSYRSVVRPLPPETTEDLKRRTGRAVWALLRHWKGNLLLVGHGGSVDAACWALAGDGWVVNSTLCSITKLVGSGRRWRVVLNGDTSHLSSPEVEAPAGIPSLRREPDDGSRTPR